jgi:hypothetical protein
MLLLGLPNENYMMSGACSIHELDPKGVRTFSPDTSKPDFSENTVVELRIM